VILCNRIRATQTKDKKGKDAFPTKPNLHRGYSKAYFWILEGINRVVIAAPNSAGIQMKFLKNSKLSLSSIPILHFIVTGIETLDCIATKQSATNSGAAIRQAPKQVSYQMHLTIFSKATA